MSFVLCSMFYALVTISGLTQNVPTKMKMTYPFWFSRKPPPIAGASFTFILFFILFFLPLLTHLLPFSFHSLYYHFVLLVSLTLSIFTVRSFICLSYSLTHNSKIRVINNSHNNNNNNSDSSYNSGCNVM